VKTQQRVRVETLNEAIAELREEMQHYGVGARAGFEASIEILEKLRDDTQPLPPPESTP
jgi:hypothetical protein